MMSYENEVALQGLLICNGNSYVFMHTYQQHVSLSQHHDKHLVHVTLVALTYVRYGWLSSFEHRPEATSAR